MKKSCPGAKKRLVLGVTGSFGSGKSTVAKILGRYGAEVIDADRIAHQLIRPGSRAYRKVVDAFGMGILKKDMTIDRAKLAKVVFCDRKLLRRLNNIVHPEVIKVIKIGIKRSKAGVTVLDAPLLLEAGLSGIVDRLIVVKTAREKQIKRIQKKTFLSRSDILSRIKSQLPLGKKIAQADFVIDNSGKIEETRKQVSQIRRQLWKS